MNDPQFEQYVQEIARQEVDKARTAVPDPANPAAATPPAGPISLDIGGRTFNYESKEQLQTALNQFVQFTAGELQKAQQPAAQADEQVQQPGSYVTGDENKWSDQEFVKRMTESPREGLRYYLNQELFDGRSEDPISDLKRSLTETELTKRSIAAYQFKENHPEFPGGVKEAQVIDGIRQQLGLPYDYNGLEAAYLVAMQRQQLPNYYQGAILQGVQQQLAQQQQVGYGNPQAQQLGPAAQNPQAASWNGGAQYLSSMMNNTPMPGNNPYLAPPSAQRVGQGGYAGPGNVDFDNMSLPELEATLARLGHPVK